MLSSSVLGHIVYIHPLWLFPQTESSLLLSSMHKQQPMSTSADCDSDLHIVAT